MTIEIVVSWTTVDLASAPFDEVIVPIDPKAASQPSLMHAKSLADQFGAGLVLTSVVEPDVRIPDEWRDHLTDLAASVAPTPCRAVVVIDESVADGIIRATSRLDRATVCMDTDAPGRLRDALQLTTTSAVVREAGCPVMLIGPDATERTQPFREVHAFVDGSPTGERAAGVAAAWASAAGLPLWLVEVTCESAPSSDGDVLETNYVARLAHRLAAPGLRTDFEVLHDHHPADAIVSWLRIEHPNALAVVGSHGRSGFSELRLGSVSMKVAHGSPVPVVVVPALRSDN
jgi:nucleotide-binding universal stress UspA family protein